MKKTKLVKPNISLQFVLLAVLSINIFTLPKSYAGEFGCLGMPTCNVWITNGYWYEGIKDEINQAWLDYFYDPNGRTFGGSPEVFFLTEVTSNWFVAQNGALVIDNVEHVYKSDQSVRIVDPGQFAVSNFSCPDGKIQEGWTGPLTPGAFLVNENARYCEGSFNPEKNAGKSDQPCPDCVRDNPIHVGTGNKFQQETDYQSPVPGGIQFRRYYNTQGASTLRLGEGWFFDYWQRLRRNPELDAFPDIAAIQAFRPDGKILNYRWVNNQWLADADVLEKLEELKDAQGVTTGWRLILPDNSVEEYFVNGISGILMSITDPNGLVTTITSDLAVAEGGDIFVGTPDKVTGPFGRELQIKYDPVTRDLITVVDPAGNEIHYSQDTNNRLISVSYPDETPLDPNDNPTRIYHYEDTNFPNHLTGITDETGNRFSTYAYDTEGRAILSEHAGGAERITVTYNADGTSTVTSATGDTQTYDFITRRGTIHAANISDPCPTCGPYQSATYDANGFQLSRTDFNGNVTTYIRNGRHLETSRTEAVGTAEERTITTEWHPTFRLPTKITEPGQETTFTYDTQGRLLEKRETEL